MTSRPPPRTIKTRSKPSVRTSKNSMSARKIKRKNLLQTDHLAFESNGKTNQKKSGYCGRFHSRTNETNEAKDCCTSFSQMK